jgi:DNA-binding transcriptional ArsR family regulator
MPKHADEGDSQHGRDIRSSLRSVTGLDRLQETMGTDDVEQEESGSGAGVTAGANHQVLGGDEALDGSPLELDQLFEILKNRRRREVLSYLWRHEGACSLGTLAEHIAAKENDTTVKQITSSQRKRVYVGLYQCHLPKMDDMDIVDFEKNRGTVELGRNAHLLVPYLSERTSGLEWARVYAGVAFVGLGSAVAGTLVTSSVLPTALIASLTVLAVGACSVVHLTGLLSDESPRQTTSA